MRAISDKVIVELLPREAESKGGIFIPEQARDKPQEGKILSVGPDVALPIEEGMIVGVSKYGGTVAEINGKEVLFIEASKVFYIVC